MRVLKLIVVTLISLASCEKLENGWNQQRSTINYRFRREAPIQNDMVPISTKTRTPSLNIVKSLNIRPLIPGNQAKILNTTNRKVNNLLKGHVSAAVNKMNAPKNLTDHINHNIDSYNQTVENNKHEPYESEEDAKIKKQLEVKEKINESQSEKAHSKPKPNHNSATSEKRSKNYYPDESKATSNKILPNVLIPSPKLKMHSQIGEAISPSNPEIRANDDIKPPTVEIAHEQTSEVIKNKEHENNITKDVEVKNVTPEEEIHKANDEVHKLFNNKSGKLGKKQKAVQEKDVSLKSEIDQTTQSNIDDEKPDNGNAEKNNVLPLESQVPSVVTVDNSLKLEGGEEILIQSNNYEEMCENTSKYDNPKLIYSELRDPQFWTKDNNEIDQYLYDNQLAQHQNMDEPYNGINYDNYYRYPQNNGQWFYQTNPGRIRKYWRNHQILIRPKTEQYKYWNGQSVPNHLYGTSQLYQNIPYYNQPSSSCSFYGY